jgi:hypothetical protein
VRLTLAALAVAGGLATIPTSDSSAQAAGVRLTLVDVTATNTYSPQNWKVDTATRTAVGTFPYGTGTYQYAVPAVIPADGAAGRLTMTVQSAQNWATGFNLTGDVDFTPAAAIEEFSSQRGPSYTSVRDFTIKPRASYPATTKFVDLVGHSYYNEGPTFTFRYSVGPEPTPEPPAPAPPSSTPTNGTVTAAQAFGLPSTRRCVSRRNFVIRLKRPGKVSYLAARVTVNGRRTPVFVLDERYLTIRGRVLTRRRLSARVDLRGLPKGTFRVGIIAVTKTLRSISDARAYRTCEPRRS